MKNANARPVDFERRSSAGPRQTLRAPKPKRWSHQDDLDALIGKRIVAIGLNGSITYGVLLAADQFTLKLDVEDQSLVTSPFVAFKSSLTSFAAAPKATAPKEA